MYKLLKTNEAGALLFALITAFILSLVTATFVFLTTNQYRLINSEIERTKAFYLAQTGVEYAIWGIRTNAGPLPDPAQTITWEIRDPSTNIKLMDIFIDNISNQPNALAPYRIRVRTQYQG